MKPCPFLRLRPAWNAVAGADPVTEGTTTRLEPQLRADAADRGELPRGLPLHLLHLAA
jgi:hypothetical protein